MVFSRDFASAHEVGPYTGTDFKIFCFCNLSDTYDVDDLSGSRSVLKKSILVSSQYRVNVSS